MYDTLPLNIRERQFSTTASTASAICVSYIQHHVRPGIKLKESYTHCLITLAQPKYKFVSDDVSTRDPRASSGLISGS